MVALRHGYMLYPVINKRTDIIIYVHQLTQFEWAKEPGAQVRIPDK